MGRGFSPALSLLPIMENTFPLLRVTGSQNEQVYGGEEHLAIALDEPCGLIVADIETTKDAERYAELLAAAPSLLDALEYLLEQTVDMDLAHGIELTEGENEARDKAIAAIAQAYGK
jgi:hypothetical protein